MEKSLAKIIITLSPKGYTVKVIKLPIVKDRQKTLMVKIDEFDSIRQIKKDEIMVTKNFAHGGIGHKVTGCKILAYPDSIPEAITKAVSDTERGFKILETNYLKTKEKFQSGYSITNEFDNQ